MCVSMVSLLFSFIVYPWSIVSKTSYDVTRRELVTLHTSKQHSNREASKTSGDDDCRRSSSEQRKAATAEPYDLVNAVSVCSM